MAIAILLAAGPPLVHAVGVVTRADLGSLNAALEGGGTVVCAFDDTIELTNTITISRDTTLDGTGHNVTLDGNNQVRLFVVETNVTLTLLHLTLSHGLATAPPTNGLAGLPAQGGQLGTTAGF